MLYNEQTAAVIEPWLAKGFHDCDFETYKAIPAANSHGLMDVRRSPKYYQFKKQNPREETDSLAFGTIVHQLVLEPDVIETKLRVKKKVDGRTKEGKAYNADFEASVLPGQVVVDEPTHESLLFVRDALASHPWTKRIIGKGKNEQVGCWIHNQTQAFCKVRYDKLLESEGWVVDVKTTRDASPAFFQREIVNRCYDLQAAFYLEGFAYQYKRRAEGYLWLCVENEKPHDIAVYTPEQTVIDHGNYKYQKALMTWADCVKSGQWPGYEQRAVPLELPGWAVYQEQE